MKVGLDWGGIKNSHLHCEEKKCQYIQRFSRVWGLQLTIYSIFEALWVFKSIKVVGWEEWYQGRHLCDSERTPRVAKPNRT